MLVLILSNIIVIACSSLLVTHFFKTTGLFDSILAGFILFFAQIVLVGLILGILGKLYLVNVVVAHSLILIGLYLAYKHKKAHFLVKPDISQFIDNNLVLFACSVFLAFFLIKLFINLINPPTCVDSLQYYLAFPAAWIKHGNLNNEFNVFGTMPILNPGTLETSAVSYYPINALLFFAWLMLPLKSAFLADAGQAPFYIIGMIAIYSILRKFGIKKQAAFLSGISWALIPNIFKELKTGSQIDIICAALFLLLFNALLLLKSGFTFKNAILLGIAIGLFVGTKVLNIVWLAAFLPYAGYIIYTSAKENKLKKWQLLGALGCIILPAILFASYMYIKNYLYTGNPLFPVDLKIMGKTIFKGLLDNTSYKTQIALRDRFDLMRIIFKEGLGPQFLILILPATFLPMVLFRYVKSKARPALGYILLFATPLLMLILFSRFINIYVARYFFVYLSLGLLTAVIFIDKLKGLSKCLNIILFISILFSVSNLANGLELVTSIISSLALFGSLLMFRKQIIGLYKSKNFHNFVYILLAIIGISLFYLNDKYTKEEFDRYSLTFSKKEAWQADIGRAWKQLNELTGSGSSVAYTGRMEFYPMYGSNLKNEVKYISVNEKEITPYNDPKGVIRESKVFSAWKNNLIREKIDYLFVALPFFDNRESVDTNKFPIEYDWASEHPENFKLVFKNSLAHIYKVTINQAR